MIEPIRNTVTNAHKDHKVCSDCFFPVLKCSQLRSETEDGTLQCCPVPGQDFSVNDSMSKHGSDRLTLGLDDLGSLFQP